MSAAPKLVLLPQVCGTGYYSYSPSDRQFGTDRTVATLQQIARDFLRNQRFEIGIGDMSFQNGATMAPHASHKDGKCVDLRPLRTDKQPMPVDISHAAYDRESTALLVASLLAAGNVKSILFNDAKIRGVTHWPGHNNHLHVIMRN